ncbi:hypothetical protein OXIME_000445 [Oxyplasma meridianum]|uniref:Uncharacterized protein n=1 Tax=Oxyplasma meridianum TaxID=3073602 RepID=A0AAX4NGM5_9ARCH
MTETDRDLEDIALIARTDLDYNLVLNECIEQSEIDAISNIWESSVYEKCFELKDKYALNLLIIHRVREIPEDKISRIEGKGGDQD